MKSKDPSVHLLALHDDLIKVFSVAYVNYVYKLILSLVN